MMAVIVTKCTLFVLTVSKAKNYMLYLSTGDIQPPLHFDAASNISIEERFDTDYNAWFSCRKYTTLDRTLPLV